MINPENVPESVWHTAMSTYHKTIKKRPGSAWQEAIAAALNAWPGVRKPMRVNGLQSEYWLELPLPPQETRDDE